MPTNDYATFTLKNGEEILTTTNSEEFKEWVADIVLENAYTRFNCYDADKGTTLVVECL